MVTPNVKPGKKAADGMIVFRDVVLSYKDKTVFTDADLTCEPRKITALVGPSGVGKSTLLRLMMGLIHADSGSIVIDGQEVAGLSERQWRLVRRKMGMVFQGGALFDSLTVAQNVGFFPYYVEREPWRKVKEKVHEILDDLGLAAEADKFPDQLSGGMKRRVALARSLIYHPKILLYDEPTTGLDPQNIEVVNELILEMNQRFGVTSVVVSHDLECIQRVADDVVLISDGRCLDIGTPRELLTSSDPGVIAFTSSWRDQIVHFAESDIGEALVNQAHEQDGNGELRS